MTNESLERGQTRVTGFADPEMDYQLMRQLGSVRYGGASVGECLALASEIKDGDPQSWVQAFAAAAKRQEDEARTRAERSHAISARDLYLVASNSYRAAEYYADIKSAEHRRFGLASRKAFLAAMHCGGIVCDEWWLDYAGLRLPAYHLRARKPNGALLMITSGYDGTLEETWMVYGRAALERGYDLLLFTLPGQMDSWRFNDTSYFRPDVEHAATELINKVLQQPGVQADRIALMGISFGGYFVLRIAAHEPRIAALIANSPIADLHAYMTSFIGVDPAQLPDEDDFTPADIPHIPDSFMDAQKRLMSANLMLRFNGSSFRDTYKILQQFRVPDADLARIRCPFLSLAGEGEGGNPLAQAEHCAGTVSGPVTSRLFTASEGADGHCQTANPAFSAAVSMDWLDETLSARTI